MSDGDRRRKPVAIVGAKISNGNPTSLADGIAVDHRQTDPKTCTELRGISEVDPPAAPAPPKAAARTQPPRNAQELERQRARFHASALALYKATSRDAETFTAALLLPLRAWMNHSK